MTTAAAVVIPTALAVGIRWWMKLGEAQAISINEILTYKDGDEDEGESPSAFAADPADLEEVKSAAWPMELPGLEKILAYDDLKDAALEAFPDGMLSAQARGPLRHALMDRCQQHVAWLLRIEREERAIERMARRGLISARDHEAYSKFAERLDAEVVEVKEEAAWLCNDGEQARQAADEIWAIAVQIWHQRRAEKQRVDTEEAAQIAAANEQTNASAKDQSGAQKRADDAKTSLKGLKGGFLGGAPKKTASPVAKAAAKVSDDEEGEVFQATQWPAELPGARHKAAYEKAKAKALRERPSGVEGHDLPEGEAKDRLRAALMQRCQASVGVIKATSQEHQRLRACSERARWRSGSGAPTADDFGRLQAFDAAVQAEVRDVKEEAEWLGDRDGAAGMGERIWPVAFEAHGKQQAQLQERNKVLVAQHEKVLKQYAAGAAKPWPAAAPAEKQRDEYVRLKQAAMQQLNIDPQRAAAMLQGRPAPQVVGPNVARQLRTALMARCQASVPLIQRLQTEAKAVVVAADRGHVDESELRKFERLDAAVKKELEDVKTEAEWLSDESGTRAGMGENVWPAAFQIYAKRRAEIQARLSGGNALPPAEAN